MQKKKDQKKNIPKTETLVSNTDNFYKEVNDVVDKYAGGLQNTSIFGDIKDTSEGFYFLFIRRNENAEEGRLKTINFGRNISMEDLLNSIESSLMKLSEPENKIDYRA